MILSWQWSPNQTGQPLLFRHNLKGWSWWENHLFILRSETRNLVTGTKIRASRIDHNPFLHPMQTQKSLLIEMSGTWLGVTLYFIVFCLMDILRRKPLDRIGWNLSLIYDSGEDYEPEVSSLYIDLRKCRHLWQWSTCNTTFDPLIQGLKGSFWMETALFTNCTFMFLLFLGLLFEHWWWLFAITPLIGQWTLMWTLFYPL